MRLLVEAVAARVRMWRSVRIARRLTAADVAATAEVDVRVARAFLADLQARGHVRADAVRGGSRIFTLTTDAQVPPPRGGTLDELRQHAWDRIRQRQQFTADEIAARGVGLTPFDRRAVTRYLETLCELAYLERIETPRGRTARWTLVRDTGPIAPLPAMGWVAYDPNLDRMITREKVRRG